MEALHSAMLERGFELLQLQLSQVRMRRCHAISRIF
jgi:hypothetical protein